MSTRNLFGVELPKGYDLNTISITLIDQQSPYRVITITTDDEGGGAYLKLDIEAGATIEHEGMSALAEIGKKMCELVDENKDGKG